MLALLHALGSALVASGVAVLFIVNGPFRRGAKWAGITIALLALLSDGMNAFETFGLARVIIGCRFPSPPCARGFSDGFCANTGFPSVKGVINFSMNEEQEKEAIRNVISTWMRASAEGDDETVLGLMAEDVVFLMPGRPPMRGKEAFSAASNASKGKMRFDGKPEVQEIHLAGQFAICWTHLTLTVTPTQGGQSMHRTGPILSIFRKVWMAVGSCSAMAICCREQQFSPWMRQNLRQLKRVGAVWKPGRHAGNRA